MPKSILGLYTTTYSPSCSPHSRERYEQSLLHHHHQVADTSDPQALYGLKPEGHHGVQQWRGRQPYETFRSKYGPQYTIPKAKLGHVSLGEMGRV